MLNRSGWSGPTFGPGVEPELRSGSRFEKYRVKTGRNRTMAPLEPSRFGGASHMKCQWVQENWSGPGKTHFQRHSSSSLSQSDPRVHFSATTKPPCAPLQPSRRHTTSSQLWTRERYVEYVYGGRSYLQESSEAPTLCNQTHQISPLPHPDYLSLQGDRSKSAAYACPKKDA